MTQGAKDVLALLEREGVRCELVRHGAAHSIEELNALCVGRGACGETGALSLIHI